MNRHRIFFLVLLILLSYVTANAQGSGIRTEYMKDNKTTRVETNMLFVYNTADQFVELMPVPQSAQIKAAGNLNGITMEWMGISMKPDQFLKLAKAMKLEFRIGNTSLPLSDRHVEIIHNFANQITAR
jgi:hypothetical protein